MGALEEYGQRLCERSSQGVPSTIPGEAKSAWMQALIVRTESEADVVGSAGAVLSTVALVLRRTFWNITRWRRAMSHMETIAGQ